METYSVLVLPFCMLLLCDLNHHFTFTLINSLDFVPCSHFQSFMRKQLDYSRLYNRIMLCRKVKLMLPYLEETVTGMLCTCHLPVLHSWTMNCLWKLQILQILFFAQGQNGCHNLLKDLMPLKALTLDELNFPPDGFYIY